MIPLRVKREEICEWLPKTYQTFIDDLRNSKSKSANKKDDDIRWFIQWGFFNKKSKSDDERIERFQNLLSLPYEDRLREDLPKIRIEVIMEAGYYTRKDRSIDKVIPQIVMDMYPDVIKIMMLKEQIAVNDPAVKESLKEFKHLLEGIYELDENNDPILDPNGKPIPYIPFELDENGVPKFGEDGQPVLRKKEQKIKEEPLNMDSILDKISDTGMASLTAREFQYLEKMSRN